jgi:hypothetical protein
MSQGYQEAMVSFSKTRAAGSKKFPALVEDMTSFYHYIDAVYSAGETMLRALFIASALLCALSGCGPLDKFYEGPDGDYGKSLFSDLQARNVKILQQRFDPKVLATGSPSTFDQMAAFFPPTPPRSVAVVFRTTQIFHLEDGTARRVTVSLQYEFENRWLLANARWRETTSGDKIIEGMNVQPLAKSLQEINSFQLTGKGIANYAILALAVALPLFCIAALVACIRTPMPRKRKILWCLGILVGFGRLGVNWTSGAISVTPLSIQFLSAGWLRWGPFAPHEISIAVPLFAMLFLWRLRQGKFEGGEAVWNVTPTSASG